MHDSNAIRPSALVPTGHLLAGAVGNRRGHPPRPEWQTEHLSAGFGWASKLRGQSRRNAEYADDPLPCLAEPRHTDARWDWEGGMDGAVIKRGTLPVQIGKRG